MQSLIIGKILSRNSYFISNNDFITVSVYFLLLNVIINSYVNRYVNYLLLSSYTIHYMLL